MFFSRKILCSGVLEFRRTTKDGLSTYLTSSGCMPLSSSFRYRMSLALSLALEPDPSRVP
jgi:hypothetical protein